MNNEQIISLHQRKDDLFKKESIMDSISFVKKLYKHPTFFRQRKNYELLAGFQEAIEKISTSSRSYDNFFDSLRYKRLFFLRSEYRRLIFDKLLLADFR